MKKLTFVFLFALSFPLLAQKAQITIIDSNLDDKELRPHFDVHRGSTHENSLPDRKSREELFSGVEGIYNWDELKKDIFFMDLKSKEIKQLIKMYPEVAKEDLLKLKDKRK